MVTFVESRLFTKLVSSYLNDDEYSMVQLALAADPEAGAVIPGSGGVRKLRWRGSARGKRGGIRIIYYGRLAEGQIWMLTLYARNEAQNIPTSALRRIKEELSGS
jgi:hypothetical protein